MLDSFWVAYAITLFHFAFWRHTPAAWCLISRGERAGIDFVQAARLPMKCLIAAGITLIAFYTSMAPWLILHLDPPLLTAQVVLVGTFAALIAYIGWGFSVMGRTLLRTINK